MLCLEPPRTRADIKHRRTARIVEVELRLHHAVRNLDQAVPLFVIQLAARQAGRVDLPLSAEDAVHQLFTGHLEGKERDGPALQGHMRREIEDECSLSHCGARSDDNEVGFLEPPRHVVKCRKARGKPRNPPLYLCKFADALHGGKDDFLRRNEGAGRLSACDREDLILGIVKLLGNILTLIIRRTGNLCTHVDERTQDRLLLYNLCIVREICRTRHSI